MQHFCWEPLTPPGAPSLCLERTVRVDAPQDLIPPTRQSSGQVLGTWYIPQFGFGNFKKPRKVKVPTPALHTGSLFVAAVFRAHPAGVNFYPPHPVSCPPRKPTS